MSLSPAASPTAAWAEAARIPAPFVYYQCPCRNLGASEADVLSFDSLTRPPQSADILTLFPLPRLYFCQECARVCCPLCVAEEIACYYCPNCLFEVPTASVKAERNRCGRNCFECPVCENTLSVVSMVEPTPPAGAGGAGPAAMPASPGGSSNNNTHYLTCGACRWDSLEVGLQFDRPTGLASQLQPHEDARKDGIEFENLRQHFEKFLKSKDANGPTPVSHAGAGGLLRGLSGGGLNLPPSLLATIPGLASFASMSRRSSTLRAIRAEHKLEAYSSSVDLLKTDDADRESAVKLSTSVTSLQQRLHQPNDHAVHKTALYPQRIQLRTKRSKRCRKCDHIVVKPEHKAQSTRFSIKMMALNHVPAITLAHPFPEKLEWDVPVRIIVRFTNPLDVPVQIALATAQSRIGTAAADRTSEDLQSEPEEGNCQVTLLAPNFVVDAARDIWDYDDEAATTAAHPTLPVAVHQKARNFCSVYVQVTPRRPVSQLPSSETARLSAETIKFSMLVHVQPLGNEDSSPTEAAGLEETAGTTAKPEKKAAGPLSCWIVVGLGDLVS
ncbi:dynactin p62 family-domain-containing protein [Geranomyces variabilis]|nr:dynactin p62 family-domain-containing protein [Geranomyces variabilis]